MVVGVGRARDLPAIIDRLVELTARQRDQRSVAEVRSAIELTDDQRARLAEAAGQRHRRRRRGQGHRRPVRARRDRHPDRRHRHRRFRAPPPEPAARDHLAPPPSSDTRSPASSPDPTGSRVKGEVETPMAELTINTSDITASLQKNLADFHPEVELRQVGRVLEVGDGIARVSGLPDVGVNELLEFEGGTVGLALNLDEESIGAVMLGDAESAAAVEEGAPVRATGRILSVPGRRRHARPGGQRPRRAHRRQGRPRRHRAAPHGDPGPRHHRPPAGARAAADRHQVDRRHDPHRPRPAPADHRRPQDRQDHRLHRHDPEPEGSGREVHLRRHRPEGGDGRARR